MALDLQAQFVEDPPARLDLAPHARRGFAFCRKGLLDALGRLARRNRRCDALQQGPRAVSPSDGAAVLARTAATASL